MQPFEKTFLKAESVDICIRLAASITPSDAEVQFNLGAVLEACEQLEEAIVAYDRAFKGGIERAQENIRVSAAPKRSGDADANGQLSYTECAGEDTLREIRAKARRDRGTV